MFLTRAYFWGRAYIMRTLKIHAEANFGGTLFAQKASTNTTINTIVLIIALPFIIHITHQGLGEVWHQSERHNAD